jgi:GcrA cell cycle regulator
MSWTPERIDELKRLWDAGHSASEIGKKLGVSKNAVVGKAHRLKLSARPSPIKRGGPSTTRRRPAAAQRQAAARAATSSPLLNGSATTTATPSGGKAVSSSPFAAEAPSRSPAPSYTPSRASRKAAGSQTCAWPIGDPGDPEFRFCGEKSVPGKPYCEAHCAQAYITKKKEEAA